MIKEIIQMGGYGFFVWTSFLAVFIFCSLVYYRTRKTLKKYEKEFAQELEKLPEEHKKRITKSSKVIGNILASQNKLS
ncbi:heme exporter protein CcmD [Pelagibacteraceae bacterium]|nr:heme exporter protein CcmD [Pelagibacteraceae bacterium]